MPITLITVDGDGTLWDFETAMRHALEHAVQMMTSWGLAIDGHDPSLDNLLADREAVGRVHRNEGLTMERLRWLAFERTMARAGLPDRNDRIDVLYQRFMELRHDGVRLFDDAFPVLEALRRKWKLALITNGNSELKRLGLATTFDSVISAHVYNVRKPDSRIFWLAANTLGIQPACVVHVGDHQREDIEGARTAGMRAVWVNRRVEPREPWCEPDAEIRDFSELPSVLDQLEQAGQVEGVRGANGQLPRG